MMIYWWFIDDLCGAPSYELVYKPQEYYSYKYHKR